jgi:hypothetical protein
LSGSSNQKEFSSESLKGGGHLDDLGIEGRIILKIECDGVVKGKVVPVLN